MIFEDREIIIDDNADETSEGGEDDDDGTIQGNEQKNAFNLDAVVGPPPGRESTAHKVRPSSFSINLNQHRQSHARKINRRSFSHLACYLHDYEEHVDYDHG